MSVGCTNEWNRQEHVIVPGFRSMVALQAAFRQRGTVEWQRPGTHCCSPPMEDHIQAGQRDRDGRTTSSDQHPAVSDPCGHGGQTESAEHGQDVNPERIVTTFLDHWLRHDPTGGEAVKKPTVRHRWRTRRPGSPTRLLRPPPSSKQKPKLPVNTPLRSSCFVNGAATTPAVRMAARAQTAFLKRAPCRPKRHKQRAISGGKGACLIPGWRPNTTRSI